MSAARIGHSLEELREKRRMPLGTTVPQPVSPAVEHPNAASPKCQTPNAINNGPIASFGVADVLLASRRFPSLRGPGATSPGRACAHGCTNPNPALLEKLWVALAPCRRVSAGQRPPHGQDDAREDAHAPDRVPALRRAPRKRQSRHPLRREPQHTSDPARADHRTRDGTAAPPRQTAPRHCLAHRDADRRRGRHQVQTGRARREAARARHGVSTS